VTTLIDHRIADRRRTVSEAGARRRLRRLLAALVIAALVGFAAWFVYQSPYLAVAEIAVEGQSRSQAAAIVAGAGIEKGVPTITVDAAALEVALLEDPWIAAAAVAVTWPGTVEVVVLEHAPAAWVSSGDGWIMASVAGTALEVAAAPDSTLPIVDLHSERVVLGGEIDRPTAAALQFLEYVGPSLAATAQIGGSADLIEATVDGYDILLGYATNMDEKATALTALLASGIPAGAVINLVSPQRPAIKSQVDIETLGEVVGDAAHAG